ncbi:nitroreductase family protein [Kaistella anthropi]|nr:nitroreductase family protein [Kaistella anthropi]
MDGYFKHITEVRSVPLESLDLFRKSIGFYINSLSQEEQQHWNEKQAYIVLGQLMFAAALEEVDSCPMEGFDENIMNEILNLDSATETATVTLALGYRAEDDHFQNLIKVRKPNEKLFKFL